jgi:hypothetical protein
MIRNPGTIRGTEPATYLDFEIAIPTESRDL